MSDCKETKRKLFEFRESMHGYMSTQMEEKKALQWFSTPQVKSHKWDSHIQNLRSTLTFFYFAKPRASVSIYLDEI